MHGVTVPERLRKPGAHGPIGDLPDACFFGSAGAFVSSSRFWPVVSTFAL